MRKAIVVLAALCLTVAQAIASTCYTLERTALRSGPSNKHKLIAHIPADAEVVMSACEGGWCKVRWNGKSGYARHSSLIDEDDYLDCVIFGDC